MDSTGAYLDHAATTPMRPEAVAAMEPFLHGTFGNPSGGHAVARAAKTALEAAREEVAELLGARPAEVVFTAGGTEADNLAVKGAARAARAAGGGDVVVTTAFEHKGVLAAVDRLAGKGSARRSWVRRANGVVDVDALLDAVDERTALVSVMLVNNEVGTIQPLEEVAARVRALAPSAIVHTDAVQAVPWLDVALAAAAADLVAISAHKFGGPKGTGALVVRNGVALEPLIEGGGQEGGLRSGTSNVAGVVAMAAALRSDERVRATPTSSASPDCATVWSTACAPRSPTRSRTATARARSPATRTSGSAASRPRRCSSRSTGMGSARPRVRRARRVPPSRRTCSQRWGYPEPTRSSSIRLSLGFASTDTDVDVALDVIPAAVALLRRAGAAA